MAHEFGVARSSNHGTQWVGVIMTSGHGFEYDVWTCSHAHASSEPALKCVSDQMDARFERRRDSLAASY
jgi:hypothetical protein